MTVKISLFAIAFAQFITNGKNPHYYTIWSRLMLAAYNSFINFGLLCGFYAYAHNLGNKKLTFQFNVNTFFQIKI